MEPKVFDSLTAKEKLSLLIAMHIRNKMEDFHCDHLSDDQMKELNPIIRKAVLESLIYSEESEKVVEAGIPKDKIEKWTFSVGLLIRMIPDYWELFKEEEVRKDIEEEFRNPRL